MRSKTSNNRITSVVVGVTTCIAAVLLSVLMLLVIQQQQQQPSEQQQDLAPQQQQQYNTIGSSGGDSGTLIHSNDYTYQQHLPEQLQEEEIQQLQLQPLQATQTRQRQGRRELLFFGRSTYCTRRGGVPNFYETRSVTLLFRNYFIRRGALPGTCRTVCSTICQHRQCFNDFRLYNATNECECILNPKSKCGNNTKCTNVNDQCACLDGFEGNPLVSTNNTGCRDINECNTTSPTGERLNNCGPNSFCTNTAGSFFCTCQKGYTGNPVAGCTDIDECSTNATICGTFGTCNNIPGSYTCTCASGYKWDSPNGICNDINECPTTNCGPNAFCTNTPGSFQCNCAVGYFTTGIPPQQPCVDSNECEVPNICGLNATCINRIGNYTCRCDRGFIGNPPSCTADACTANTGIACGTNAICKNGTTPTCSCLDGYSGNPTVSCSDIDECNINPSICPTTTTECFNRLGTYECLIKAGNVCPTRRDSTCVIGLKCAQRSRSDTTYQCCNSTSPCTGGSCCNGSYQENELCPSGDDLDCASGLKCGQTAVLSTTYKCCRRTVANICV